MHLKNNQGGLESVDSTPANHKKPPLHTDLASIDNEKSPANRVTTENPFANTKENNATNNSLITIGTDNT